MTVPPDQIETDISNINDAVFHAMEGEDDGFRLLSLKSGSDGFIQWVEFCGEAIWESENDERAYDEATDEHEPLEPFLRRKMLEIADRMEKLAKALKSTP